MSPSECSHCIRQLFKLDEDVAGLYAEVTPTDGNNRGRGKKSPGEVLIPLSHVITNIASYTSVPLHVMPVRHLRWQAKRDAAARSRKMYLQDPATAVAVAGGVGAAYYYGYLRLAFEFIIMLPYYFVDVAIETPLKQLYRNGPGLLGWEGEDMARICARITYHGDHAFWTKNMDECLKIYNSKEAAVLLVGKPLLYAFFAVLFFVVIHALVKASAVSKPDPDMVATYKAFKYLSRSFRGGVGGGGGARR